MSDSAKDERLSGLARSIDSLFAPVHERPLEESASALPESSEAPLSADPESLEAMTPDPVVVEAVAEEGVPEEDVVSEQEEVLEEASPEWAPQPSETSDDRPSELAGEIDAFLAGGPADPEGRADRIASIATALRENNVVDPLADGVERLVLAGGDPLPDHVRTVVRGLLYSVVASRIVARLGAERDEKRRAALTDLCRLLGREMADSLTDALAQTTDRAARRAYVEAMVAMGEESLPFVEKMLADDRWFVVRNAVAILGEIGGDRAVEWTLGTLSHPEAKVRREAVQTLTKVGGEDAGQLALWKLEDTDAGVRLAAARAVGEFNLPKALKPLLALLKESRDPAMIIAIVRSLGQIGDPGAVIAIEKHALGGFFSKPSADVRITAYRALHRMGTPHARRLLNRAVDDKDPEIKKSVRELLGMA